MILIGVLLAVCAACAESERAEETSVMPPNAAGPASFDAATSTLDAAFEPADGSMLPSDAAVVVVDPCELEVTGPQVEDDSPLNCRGETLKPEDEELTWLGLWAEQAEQRVFVYWGYDDV